MNKLLSDSSKPRSKSTLFQKLVLVLVLVFPLFTSCFSSTESKISTPTKTPSTEITPTKIMGSIVETTQPDIPSSDVNCVRPYEDSSIWNIPIDWSIAQIHPDSKKMMDAFFKSTLWIGSDASQYAPNIYFVDNKTPLVFVKLRQNRFRDAFSDIQILYGEPASTIWMPIPKIAQPAPGSDGQLVIVNRDTGEEWGLIKGAKDLDGNWIADGAYRYSIQVSGIPPVGFGQRGAGISQLAGIIRPCEIDRGFIDHAVTLAYDFPCAPDSCQENGWPAVIPPFTKTDGDGKMQYDIPEGARIVIRPEISLEEIDKACLGKKGCIVWVRAMQNYGGFIVDKSNHPKTYPEGYATAHWDPNIWSSQMLRNIPPEWYDVIDWNMPFTENPN